MYCFAMPSRMKDFITSNRLLHYNSFLKSLILNKMYGSCFSLHILSYFWHKKYLFLLRRILGYWQIVKANGQTCCRFMLEYLPGNQHTALDVSDQANTLLSHVNGNHSKPNYTTKILISITYIINIILMNYFPTVPCTAGSFSPTGLTPCTLCNRRSFQPRNESRVCFSCPGTTATLKPGSKNSQDCIG